MDANEIILIILIVMVAVAGYFIRKLDLSVSSYTKEVGKKYGEIEAITLKLDEVCAHTSKLTEAKSSVDHNYWRKREAEQLKRQKLEEYCSLINLIKDNCHLDMQNKLLEMDNKYDEQAYNKADLIQALYFPELSQSHNQFRKAMIEYENWQTLGMVELFERRKSGESHPVISSEHMEKYGEFRQKLSSPAQEIIENAKEVALQLTR